MDDFNWVKERAECNAAALFEKLKDGAESDVNTRVALDGPATPDFGFTKPERTAFTFAKNGDSFRVQAQNSAGRHVIKFLLVGQSIVVEHNDEPFLEASVALCDDAHCRLKLKDRSVLELWQFRRRALERLFFGE